MLNNDLIRFAIKVGILNRRIDEVQAINRKILEEKFWEGVRTGWQWREQLYQNKGVIIGPPQIAVQQAEEILRNMEG